MRGQIAADASLRVRARVRRRAGHPLVDVRVLRVRLGKGVFAPWLLNTKGSPGSALGPGSEGLEVLQPHHLAAPPDARHQLRHLLAELGAHAKVDERVVEAGGLGEEPGDDACGVGNLEAPGGPHGHHGVGGPGQDERCADHNGHLETGETGATAVRHQP